MGISLIVLISTFIIGVIFILQYKELTLRETEKEIEIIADQFVEVGKVLINPMQQRPRRVYIEAMRNLSNAEVWIVGLNNQVVLDTTEKVDFKTIQELVIKFKAIEDAQITDEYSDYFAFKTISIVKPIIDGGVVGLVVVHKDVNSLYQAYSSFNFLVFFSLFLSVLISIILAIFYAKFFTKPLDRINQTVGQIKNGNYHFKTRIKREDQIGELAKTIDLMSGEIEKSIAEINELEKMAKELVSNVSHEFKTPLTLIKGYTINMRDKTIKPNKEVYNKIINNSEILEQLVNDLLEINRYQSKTVVLKKEEVELNSLILDVIGDMQIVKNREIEFNGERKVIITADSLKIKQLLMIFIDNAIKYSNDNKKIIINLFEKEIEIIDFGKGIETCELEKIFNRYYKINDSEAGYGLGLFIAKHIVELHGYQLEVKSERNVGTKIKVIF